MSRVIVFDVNETLLDLKALDPIFARLFGDAAMRRLWFVQMLQLSLVATITNRYTDFGTLGRAALDMVATRQGVVLTDADRMAVRDAMLSLPPHPEVSASLERLRAAGLRLATLTNSAQQAAEAQLRNAGLIEFFEQVLTVETVQRFKPAAEVYHMAAEKLGTDPGGMRMVAAHNWDITGAMRAGCAGAFIARPGMVLGPLDETPDIIGKNLAEVTEQILKTER
jgi:2-haloacid dehalogenase